MDELPAQRGIDIWSISRKDATFPVVNRGSVDRVTHFRLFPPSWLHSSKVKPSNPSVCKATALSDTHAGQTQHHCGGVTGKHIAWLPLQHRSAHSPAPQFHLRFPAQSCSPGRTSRRTAAEELRVKKIKRQNNSLESETIYRAVGSQQDMYSPILIFLLDLRTALTQPANTRRPLHVH